MFDTAWIDDLDGDAACDAVAAVHRGQVEAEAQMLYLAAHWADLHNGDALDTPGTVLPGMERAKQLGGPGTPKVAEFAAAEFGALRGTGYISADHYQRDALNLRHRHPLLWAAVFAGAARVWQAREVAKLLHAADLSADQAHWVDAQTSHRLSSLPWGRFLAVVEAKIIEADPDAAEARRVAAAMDRFVRTGRCNEYGLKTIIIKAEAGEVIFFVAMANPARALALLQDYAQVDPSPTSSAPPAPAPEAPNAEDPAAEDEREEPVGEADLHPRENDADDPPPPAGDSTGFVKPMRVDPKKLLPPATLYIHLSEDSFTRNRRGVAPVRRRRTDHPRPSRRLPAPHPRHHQTRDRRREPETSRRLRSPRHDARSHPPTHTHRRVPL